MKIKNGVPIIILYLLFVFNTLSVQAQTTSQFQASIRDIPQNLIPTMKRYTWRPECPVSLKNLAYVQLFFWGFDDQPHQGVLIVNKDVAQDVVQIFKRLYQIHFPIQSLNTMDQYQGDDARSMSANNTSAFNCRAMSGTKNIISQHSYGRAIDINPLINPYINGRYFQPPNANAYLDRNQRVKGMITENSEIYRIFHQHGWSWGGKWQRFKDDQHFEKGAK